MDSDLDRSKRPSVRINLAGKSFNERYKLLNGSIIPRPIAFVTTIDESGAGTGAPFSAFMIASVEEGLLAFSVGPSEHPKSTLRNIRRTHEYVINTVPESIASEVQRCGENGTESVQRFASSGLSLVPSYIVCPPRLAESKVQFECKLRQILIFGGSHMIIGAIVAMHAEEGLVANGKIDPLVYAPLGRIAGRNYCRVREIISV